MGGRLISRGRHVLRRTSGGSRSGRAILVRDEGGRSGSGGWRTTVGAGEVALDAIAAWNIAIAADLAGTAGQASFTLARPATDRIRRHCLR